MFGRLFFISLFIAMSAAATAQGFDDEFNGSIDSRWVWVRPDATRQLIFGTQLTIITQNGALYGKQFNNTRNILLQDAPPSPYALETKVSFKADSTFHSAGLLYYLDDDNYVSVSKAFYLGQDVALFGWDENGVYRHQFVPIEKRETLYLRLTVRGVGHFTGEYSITGAEWLPIHASEIPFSGGGRPRIGILASNGEGVNLTQRQIAAKFDYFRVNRTVPVEEISPVHPAGFAVRIAPIPVRTGSPAQIMVTSDISAEAQLSILSIGGRVVEPARPVRVLLGTNIFPLPLQHIPPGVYVVMLTGRHAMGSAILLVSEY